MIELQEFIHNNLEWRKLLTEQPYNLKISEDEKYVLFKYNQIDSDFSKNIVRQSRGIILRKSDFKIVCWPFDKFFNYGEMFADKIDFNKSKVQTKIDGSIMKLWYDDEWHLSTNGTINAFKSTCPTGETFASLFFEGLKINFADFVKNLNKHYTYIFEMTHPLTRVVIPYKEAKVFHIGTRNNETGEELITDIGLDNPKEYAFKSLEDVIQICKNLPYTEEGYVVVEYDKNKTKRVKVKSPSYLAVHHMKNNGVISYNRIVELILKNEQSEFLSVFAEYKIYFDKVENKYLELLKNLQEEVNSIKDKKFESKKDFALTVKDFHCPDFFFRVYNGEYKWGEFKKFLFNKGSNKVTEILKLK